MSETTKIGATHLSRAAYVYLRQSSAAQVEHNRESTQRQYALASKATTLGWPQQQIVVIDDDLGLSGSGFVERSGFARLTAEVALGHVGIVLGLAHGALETKQQSIVEQGRMIDTIGIADERVGEAAEIKQAIPVGIIASETGDFEAEHDADVSERDFGSEAGEATALDEARTG